MRHTDKTFPYSPEERTHCLDPLAQAIRARHRKDGTLIVGIQGGQGTGKTTLAVYLSDRLACEGFKIVSFSVDDFYTSYAERKLLAQRHPDNPFFQIPRGMPGTHRTDELYDTLCRLRDGLDVDLPVFDKSAHLGFGDIADHTVPVRGRQDIILFEGWCLGVPECTFEDLSAVCVKQGFESLRSLLDPLNLDGVLSNVGAYLRVWGLIDLMVALSPDSLSLHEVWRLEQEQDLIARTGAGMTDDQVREMVRHFLPITCLCYARVIPDLRIRIDREHRYYALSSDETASITGTRASGSW